MNLDIPFLSGGGGGGEGDSGGNSGGGGGDGGGDDNGVGGGNSGGGGGDGGGGDNGVGGGNSGEGGGDGGGGDNGVGWGNSGQGGRDGESGDNAVGGGNSGGSGGGGETNVGDGDGGEGGGGDEIQSGEDGNGDGGGGGGAEGSGSGNRVVIIEDHYSDEDSEYNGSGDEDNDISGNGPKRRGDVYKYYGDDGKSSDGKYTKREGGSKTGSTYAASDSESGSEDVFPELEKSTRRKPKPRENGLTRRGNIIENISMDDKGNIIPSEDEFLIVIDDPDPDVVEGIADHFGATQCHVGAKSEDTTASTKRNRAPVGKNMTASKTQVEKRVTRVGEGDETTPTRKNKVDQLHIYDGNPGKIMITNKTLTDHRLNPPAANGKKLMSYKTQNAQRQELYGKTDTNVTSSNTSINQRQTRHGEVAVKTQEDIWQTRTSADGKYLTGHITPVDHRQARSGETGRKTNGSKPSIDHRQARSSGNGTNTTGSINQVDDKQVRTRETDRNMAGIKTLVDHRQARSSGNSKNTTGSITKIQDRLEQSGETDRNMTGSKTHGEHKQLQAHETVPYKRPNSEQNHTSDERQRFPDKHVTPRSARTPREPILKRRKLCGGNTLRGAEQGNNFGSGSASGSKDGRPSKPSMHTRNLSDRPSSGTALSREQTHLNLHDSASYNKHMYKLISNKLPNDSSAEDDKNIPQGCGAFDWSDKARVKDEIRKSRGLPPIGKSNDFGKINGNPPRSRVSRTDRVGYGSGSGDGELPPITPVKKSPPKKPFGEKRNIHTIFTMGEDSDTKEIVYKKGNLACFRDKD